MTARRVFRLFLLVIAIALAARNLGYFGATSPETSTESPRVERRDPVVVEVPPEAIGRDSRAPAPSPPAAPATTTRDLEQDEARGGHTIARHVGKSDADLRARLARERRISAASTYTDLATAERVVSAAIVSGQARIARWVARDGNRPNLAIDFAGVPGDVIGRSIAQGDETAQACHDAVVVLRWDARANDWFVLTSYPEVRRGR